MTFSKEKISKTTGGGKEERGERKITHGLLF